MLEWLLAAALSIALGAGVGTVVALLMTRKIGSRKSAVPPGGHGQNPYQP
ncbi:hypothetical protein ABT324_23360 [Saccharopolyspora sp. NPDC000359]